MTDSNNPQEIIKQENPSQPSSEDSASTGEIAAETEVVVQEKESVITTTDDDPEKDLNVEELDKATASLKESEENNDGFKTPTSPDHKIPAITQCPPPPRKTWPPPSTSKRKASPPQIVQLSEPSEIDLIFRANEDNLDGKKTKKARMDDEG